MTLIKVAVGVASTLLREGLKRILAAESDLLVVGEAADDIGIIDVVQRSRPDVLLLDLKIPRREAVPILLEVAEQHLSTKVIILGSSAEKEGILNTAKAGARGYVLNRTHPSTLMQAIRSVDRGEIWADRQLNCAETFVEFASRTWGSSGTKSDITRMLSERELEALALVAKGLNNQQLSQMLFISLGTVKVHLNRIFGKLGVKNRTQAALVFTQALPLRADAGLRTVHAKSGHAVFPNRGTDKQVTTSRP